ncbi:MAG TPA: PBP1A family penicillin-binding protein [Coriobacteriia bacterium]|jgi:penicillin-binding protein 1A
MDGSSFERPPLRRQPGDEPPAHPRGAGGTRRPRRAPKKRATPRLKAPAAQRAKRPAGRRKGWRIALLALLLAVVALSVVGCAMYSSMLGQLPDPGKPLRGRDQTSHLLDRKGRVIADLFAEQNRTSVKLSEMPASLQHAVVATEDERFYRHQGVDLWATGRALWTDVVLGRKAQGGSTITQQYVKNAFTNQERTLKRKVQEAMLAYQVEKRFSKEHILEMYLNTIYFGHGAYGVERASEVYFGKPVGKLDVAESAMLAGVIKSPGRYSPRIDPEAARKRRRVVLSQMRDQGFIDASTFAEADAEAFKLASPRKAGGVAPYFVEYVKNTLVEKFGADLVYRGGLSVRTTLDLDMQRAAEKAVADTLDRKGDPSAALVAIEPATGEVRAMVGGSDFDTQQYNVAVQGHRQPGSAFKPFVLAAALQNGVSPEQTFESGPVELMPQGSTTAWKVTGAGGDRTGPMRLREAAERSVNSVFAQLILQIGPQKVVDAAHALGILTPVRPLPAIALGGLEQGVSPLEMASAYGTLANGGVAMPAHGIAEVRDAGGTVLLAGEVKPQRAVTAAVAYLTTDILKGVIARGTGTSAEIGRPAAGKTGTTQAYRDAWFAGYTPQLSAAVWVGYPDAAKEMTSVHGRKVTGGSFPAQIWSLFMKKALTGTPKSDFPVPASGLTTETICLDTGLAATDYCPRKGEGLFLSDALPKPCGLHSGPPKVAVPAVIGLTRGAAEAALKKAGFGVAAVEAAGSSATSGTVTSQDPAAGTLAPQDSTVTIAIAGAGGQTSARPTAAFTSTFGGSSFTVVFDGSPSAGQGSLKFAWDFGDGTTGSGRAATHAYATKGKYVVTLRVTDSAGRSGSTARTIHLK